MKLMGLVICECDVCLWLYKIVGVVFILGYKLRKLLREMFDDVYFELLFCLY